MGLLQNPELVIDVDAVLRGQGADPTILRARNPILVNLAEHAIKEGLPLLRPQAVYRELAVTGIKHDRLLLTEGELKSKLLVKHLAKAQRVFVILATIGDLLEEHIIEVGSNDLVYALALDGVGSAAVEALANAACRYFEEKALEMGFKASIPFSPGMVEWPVEEGQPEIFRLMEGSESDVRLTESCMMVPRKSLSMVLGIGKEMEPLEKTCDYCPMGPTCRYRDLYTVTP